jgi:branched-chain amino acid transport system ATP-binding protein
VSADDGLRVEAVSVQFGPHLALASVDLQVPPAQVTGLIGPNGAGKTTLFNVVCGLLRPSRGRVLLDGTDITRLATHRRARLGIGRTFQRLELFTDLSVRDNLRVAGEVSRRPLLTRAMRGRPSLSEHVDEVLDLVGLADVGDASADELSTGTARLVELGRALMARPRVLLLDEPASGLGDDETAGFGRLLRALAATGLAVLLVEHDMSLVMEVCDQLHVLDFGAIIASGTPVEIRADQRVLDAYLGAPA